MVIRTATPLTLLALTTLAIAQRPPEWSVQSIPNGVRLAQLQQRGKVLAYADGPFVTVWSAVTRSWTTLTTSTNATVRVANDLVFVADGPKFYAFASHTGRFATLTLTKSATVLNPQSNRNDSVMLVRDGNDLWSFSGFEGTWRKQTIAGNAIVQVRRHTAIVAEDRRLLGLSAFGGGWVSTPKSVRTGIAVDGTVAIAQSTSTVWGFSAVRRTWATTALNMTQPSAGMHHDVALWADGVSALGFSGLRGTFARQITGTRTIARFADQVLMVYDAQGRFWFYSAATSRWLAVRTTDSTATHSLSASHGLVFDGTKLTGLSGPLGTMATTTTSSNFPNLRQSANVSSIEDPGGVTRLYSGVTGRFTILPSRIKPTPQRITTNGALFRTSTGVSAWSARSGKFHDLRTSSAAVLHGDSSSAILAVEDGKTLAVFDPRRDAWTTATIRGGAPLKLHYWRTSLAAFDGERVFGFGASHGRIASVKLTGTFREVHSNSESSRAITDKAIVAFSATPLLTTPWQYPEFRRTFAAGAPLDFYLGARNASGLGFLALGAQAPFALPGLGDVLLDGTTLLPWTLGLSSTAPVSVTVPDWPALRGLELFMQGLVIPKTGQPFVTTLGSVRIH